EIGRGYRQDCHRYRGYSNVREAIAVVGQNPDKMIFPMAATRGLAVATIYCNQPLLPLMASGLGRQVRTIGIVATSTQPGYSLGLLLFVLLGDRVDRRRLILLLLLSNIGNLLLCSATPSL